MGGLAGWLGPCSCPLSRTRWALCKAMEAIAHRHPCATLLLTTVQLVMPLPVPYPA